MYVILGFLVYSIIALLGYGLPIYVTYLSYETHGLFHILTVISLILMVMAINGTSKLFSDGWEKANRKE